MLREVLDQAGLGFDHVDYLIPHQTIGCQVFGVFGMDLAALCVRRNAG